MAGTNQKEKVAEVRRSRPYHVLVGVGLVSYGLLHLVIAWIALQLVFGKRGDASQQGALSQLARQPLGAGLLWVMAFGLFTLTVWQAVEATIGRDQDDRDGRMRRRLSSAGRAVVYLALGVLAIGVAVGSGSKSGKGEETLSAKLMSVPFGQVLVAAVGAAVIAVGIAQIVKGVKQKFTEDLDRGVRPAVQAVGHRWLLRQGHSAVHHRRAVPLGRGHLRSEKGGRYGRRADDRPGPAVRHSAVGDHGGRHRMLRGVLLLLGADGALLSLRLELAPQLGRRLDQPGVGDQLTKLVPIDLVQIHQHNGRTVVMRRREERL